MYIEQGTGTHRGWVLAGLLLGLMLAAIEVSVVATAMPDVIEDLGGQQLYSLPFAIYLLMATVSSPLWGYASDLHGSRRLYTVAVIMFLVGSALSGASFSMGWLVAARAVQGLGGGGLQTLTFTMVGELYSLKERSKVQGYISGVWGVSALVGPLLGGFIVDHFSWRWVFYLNIPFGLAGAAVVRAMYHDRPRSRASRPDLVGAAVFAVGAGLLVYGLQTHQLLLGLVGLAMLMIFPPLELRHPAPLVPLRLLRDPLLARTVLGNLLAGMAFFGIANYLPLFAQEARGESATIGGALLSPTTVGWTLSGILAAQLIPRLGLRPLARSGAFGMVAGFGLLMVTLSAPLWIIGATGFLSGLGMGSVMLALLVGAQEEAPREALGSITAMILFARNIGGSLGAALMGALLGPTQEQGGEALAQVFWRVPGASALLSLGVLLIVARLPDLKERAAAIKTAQAAQVREEKV